MAFLIIALPILLVSLLIWLRKKKGVDYSLWGSKLNKVLDVVVRWLGRL